MSSFDDQASSQLDSIIWVERSSARIAPHCAVNGPPVLRILILRRVSVGVERVERAIRLWRDILMLRQAGFTADAAGVGLIVGFRLCAALLD
jgi:hypothetical protein